MNKWSFFLSVNEKTNQFDTIQSDLNDVEAGRQKSLICLDIIKQKLPLWVTTYWVQTIYRVAFNSSMISKIVIRFEISSD